MQSLIQRLVAGNGLVRPAAAAPPRIEILSAAGLPAAALPRLGLGAGGVPGLGGRRRVAVFLAVPILAVPVLTIPVLAVPVLAIPVPAVPVVPPILVAPILALSALILSALILSALILSALILGSLVLGSLILGALVLAALMLSPFAAPAPVKRLRVFPVGQIGLAVLLARLRRVEGDHHAVIMVRMLMVVLRHHPVAGRGRIARQGLVFLVQLGGGAAQADAGPVAVERLVAARPPVLVVPAATAALIAVLSHPALKRFALFPADKRLWRHPISARRRDVPEAARKL